MRTSKSRVRRVFITCLAICLPTAGIAVAATHTRTFSSGNVSKFINDHSTTVQKINVTRQGRIKDINVRVRLNHTDTNDLNIWLRSPGGKYVFLFNERGSGTNDNLGSGPNNCNGTPTTFDDEASTTLSSGSSPFASGFKPEQLLSRFDGKLMQGKWELVVYDDANADTGHLGCVKLKIRYRT